MTLRFAVAGLLAVLVPLSALAQSGVYKWKDENGKIHFSNVPRAGAELVAPEAAPPPAEEPAPVVEGVAPAQEPVPVEQPRVAAPVGTPGPFSNLSDEAFSTRVTAERLKLRRELTAAKRELADLSREYEGEVARKRVPTPEQIHDRIFIGVTGVENGAPPDREEELRLKKEAAQKRVEEIRARYAAIEAEATQRYGSLPGWWLSIE
jgi:hypothetical protein